MAKIPLFVGLGTSSLDHRPPGPVPQDPLERWSPTYGLDMDVSRRPRPMTDDEVRSHAEALKRRIDETLLGVPETPEQTTIRLLEEIRDTLRGVRGFLSIPTTQECLLYGRKQ